MSDLLPGGENLRRAVQWISEMRKQDPEARTATLVEAASKRFNLGPQDEEFLLKTLTTKT